MFANGPLSVQLDFPKNGDGIGEKLNVSRDCEKPPCAAMNAACTRFGGTKAQFEQVEHLMLGR